MMVLNQYREIRITQQIQFKMFVEQPILIHFQSNGIMRQRFLLLCILLFPCFNPLFAQKTFPDQCLGQWKGMMYIYSRSKLVDSVLVRFTAAPTAQPDAWTWKTEYISEKLPMVKDYVLRVKDAAKGRYVTDEGDGIELAEYVFGNKMYSVFETGGILLTSSYELRGSELIFEVTSGEKLEATNEEVTNYSTNNLQRVVLRREK